VILGGINSSIVNTVRIFLKETSHEPESAGGLHELPEPPAKKMRFFQDSRAAGLHREKHIHSPWHTCETGMWVLYKLFVTMVSLWNVD
jgi:hypothetical protein